MINPHELSKQRDNTSESCSGMLRDSGHSFTMKDQSGAEIAELDKGHTSGGAKR